MKNFKIASFCFLLTLFSLISCKKFITVPPPENLITQQNVYADDFTAAGVLTNLYSGLSFWPAYIARYTGLSGDDFSLWPNADINQQAYYTNNLQATATVKTGIEIWNNFYPFIFTCNAAIEGISVSRTLSPNVKKQLLGEAYFIRAFFYHHLVVLYGDLPLVKSTDSDISRQLKRSPVSDVYSFIINDLLQAKELLGGHFLDGALKPYAGNAERVRPTKWAATALLARVYLYNGEYAKSEAAATEVIGNSASFNLSSLSDVFLKNNSEAIWQLQPIMPGFNTQDGQIFNLRAFPAGISDIKPIHLSRSLMKSFEQRDNRAVQGNWVDSIIQTGITPGVKDTFWFPNKYKEGASNSSVTSTAAMSEYVMVLRLGEQYLIRAEARARLNNISGAKSDLDAIRSRAGLPGTTATDQSSVISAIFRERRVELFSEWNHRWIDLKRSGTIDDVMSVTTPLKGGTWETTDQLYPIPYDDIIRNPMLIQNQGY